MTTPTPNKPQSLAYPVDSLTRLFHSVPCNRNYHTVTMRLTGSGVYTRAQPAPKMPSGLLQLMEDLTRDVLKHNPPNVYEFCANHMQQLLVVRDGNAPKQNLTLDQKIQKAQEKVRARADERRRKYDEEMKKIDEEMKQNTHEENSEKPKPENGETANEVGADTNMKAPVHHEQDLAKALEVEIFHKPIAQVTEMVTNATKNESSDDTKDNVPDPEVVKELEKQDLSADLSSADVVNNLEIKGLLIADDNVVDGNPENNSIELTRVPRSVASEEKDEVASKPVLDDKEIMDNQSLELMSDAGIDATLAKEDITFPDNIINIEDVTGLVTKISDEENVAAFTDESTNVLNSETGDNLSDTKKTATLDDNIVADQLNLKEETNDEPEHVDKIADDSTVLVASNEDLPITDDTEKIGANTDPKEIKEAQKTVKVDSHKDLSQEIVNKTALPVEEIIRVTTATDLGSKVESSLEENKKLNIEADEDMEVKSEVQESASDLPSLAIDDNNEEEKHNSKNEIPENSNGHAQLVEQIEVADKPSDDSQNEQNSNDNLKDRNNGNSDTKMSETSGNAVLSEDHKTEIETDMEDGITTVNKVLINESADNNDNDSAPVHTVTIHASEINGENINGSHEILIDNVFENGSETPEPDNMIINNEDYPNDNITKDDETVALAQDVITESIKIDDTSSMGKSSSMDDSIMEESNDSIIEADITQSNTEKTNDNPSTMDLETAAVTIQKVFRNFMFKSRGSTFDDTGVDESNSIEDDSEKVQVEFPVSSTSLKERRTLGISRMDTVLQTVNEEKSLSLSTDDSSLSSAATIIQAHVRGFLVRNRLNSNKTSSASLVNSEGHSTSLEADGEPKANKTVLNIHIVPEGENFLSRDESLLTSIDLSLDGSPPSSTNLHPLGYDKSQPRKQLKREDAIQSISPPSNNSGKLSEDVESVKDMVITESEPKNTDTLLNEPRTDVESRDSTPTRSATIETVIEAHPASKDGSGSAEQEKDDTEPEIKRTVSLLKQNSDESDVITPYDDDKYSTKSDDTSQLIHSGEFHDIIVLPTKVSRSDTAVVREFKNVLVYFLLWNNS